MKKAMLFIVSLLFAVSANAATLDLSNVSNGSVGTSTGAFVTGGTTTDGNAFSSVWSLSTGEDTNANFAIGFSTFDPFPLLNPTVVSGAIYTLLENGLSVATSGPSDVEGFSFSYFLLAAKTYTLEIAGISSANPTSVALAVQAVPVPAALFLFAPALLGLLGLRRKSVTAVAA